MRTDGWFANDTYLDEFPDFFKLRKRGTRTYLGYTAEYAVPSICKMILFGKIDSCDNICGRDNCSQKTGEFCKRESISERNERYGKTNYYRVWRKMKSRLASYQEDICNILGRERYDSFMEYLTMKAHDDYCRFTKREIKEKGYEEPTIYETDILSVDTLLSDPWDQYINEKLKKGELKCLNFSDLDLLA